MGREEKGLSVHWALESDHSPEHSTVFDLRERNANTRKMVAPLASIDGILRRVAGRRFRSLFDLQAAYEQIRVVTEHLNRTSVTTPDGNVISLVMQQRDCNAPATCQALMNHLFSAYIGVFMDVYLDDIIVYSDTEREEVSDPCKGPAYLGTHRR